MNVNLLVKIVIFGVCVLGLSSYYITKNKGIQTFDNTQLLTDFNANLVDGISMESAEHKELVSAEKVSGQWHLPNKYGYAADVEKLSNILQSLKDGNIVELKTKQEKYFDRLGLQDLSNPTSAATLLTIISGDKDIKLLLGNESTSSNGRYIRFAGQSQSYLVDLDIDIPNSSTDWLTPNIVNVDFDQIRKVDIMLPDEQFSILRKELLQDTPSGSMETNNGSRLADNFELTKNVEGKTVQYNSIFTGLVRNIVNLSLNDVQLAEQHKMEVFQTITLNYVEHITKQDSQLQPLSLKLFKTDDEVPLYWLQKNNDKWLLQISEFDFKQVSKSLDGYLE